MPEERCERSELLVSQCAHCRADGTPPDRTRTAEFKTACTACGRTIQPGDRIGLVLNNWICCYRKTRVSK